MQHGVVRWYNKSKGYGFIKVEQGEDLFVHYSFLKDGTVIKNGDEVIFEICNGEKGLWAKNVAIEKEGKILWAEEC